MYYREIKELSVLSLYEGELLGKVDKLLFDEKLKKLIELELIGEDGAKLKLKTKDIYNVGKNAITIKNNNAISIKTESNREFYEPLGCKVFSINGEFLGVAEDVVLNNKFVVEKLVLNNNELLDINKLASCGKNAVVFFTNEEKINVKNFTPNKNFKMPKLQNKQEVLILPVEKDEQEINNNTQVQFQNANFLLGRTCVKDIVNFNNEILIKAQTVVNKKNLKEVNKFGKLRELMLYSK